MSTLVELLEFLLLVFIGIAWYVAKRDLTAAAAMKQSPALAELRELRETVEQLISVLEEKAEAAEKRLALRIAKADGISAPAAREEPMSAEPPKDAYAAAMDAVREAHEQAASQPEAAVAPPKAPDRYQQVYELEDAGIAEPAEIARQTGLGLAEVSLVLSLRPR